MPIYEYECKKCNEKFEFFIANKNDKVRCPKCRSTKLEKLMSVCNAVYKGSGFYNTEYKNKKGS